jgi:hypothetical protein
MSVQVELKPVATTDTKVSALSRRIAVSADKWGIEGFMEAVEQEVARFNIGVTIVEQGGARTDFRHGGAQLGAVQFHSKTPGGQSFWRPNTISKSWLWNRKTISPGCLQQGALRLNQPTIASPPLVERRRDGQAVESFANPQPGLTGDETLVLLRSEETCAGRGNNLLCRESLCIPFLKRFVVPRDLPFADMRACVHMQYLASHMTSFGEINNGLDNVVYIRNLSHR